MDLLFLDGGVMQGDDCGMQIEVGMDGRWVADALRETELFGQEHEGV